MKVDPDIVKKYLPADDHILVNEDDERLRTIRIPLPEPPPLEEIEGYGLPPKEQFWKVPEYPKRLKELERSFTTIDEIWDKLNSYRDQYLEEWKFIEREWDRRINGHWLFINGKPTYIDGWHYVYCGYYRLDIGLPEYRSRDRKFFLTARYCYTTTEAYFPARVSYKGKVVEYFQNEIEAKKFKKKARDKDFIIETGNFFFGYGHANGLRVELSETPEGGERHTRPMRLIF